MIYSALNQRQISKTKCLKGRDKLVEAKSLKLTRGGALSYESSVKYAVSTQAIWHIPLISRSLHEDELVLGRAFRFR